MDKECKWATQEGRNDKDQYIYMYRCTNSFVVKYSLNNIGLHLPELEKIGNICG